MSVNPFRVLDDQTTKGAVALASGQAVFGGVKAQSLITFTGVIVDRDTVTIDGDVFELVDISTDSTFDTLTDLNNTTDPVNLTRTAHGFVKGDYLAVENEILLVTFSDGADVFTVSRGEMGTTNAAHSTGTDPIAQREATALTAGALIIPVLDLTADESIDRLDVGVAEKSTAMWSAKKMSATVSLIESKTLGARAAVITEALTNATVITPTYGGTIHTTSPVYSVEIVPTAAQVTAGDIFVSVPFVPSSAVVQVRTTSTQAIVAWDGVVGYTLKAKEVLVIDNAGSTDWAEVSTLHVLVYGSPVTVANSVVLG